MSRGEVRGRGIKRTNEYVQAMGVVFDKIPKAVLAAVAVSLAIRIEGEGNLDEAMKLILAEWSALYENRIVPQRPPQ